MAAPGPFVNHAVYLSLKCCPRLIWMAAYYMYIIGLLATIQGINVLASPYKHANSHHGKHPMQNEISTYVHASTCTLYLPKEELHTHSINPDHNYPFYSYH